MAGDHPATAATAATAGLQERGCNGWDQAARPAARCIEPLSGMRTSLCTAARLRRPAKTATAAPRIVARLQAPPSLSQLLGFPGATRSARQACAAAGSAAVSNSSPCDLHFSLALERTVLVHDHWRSGAGGGPSPWDSASMRRWDSAGRAHALHPPAVYLRLPVACWLWNVPSNYRLDPIRACQQAGAWPARKAPPPQNATHQYSGAAVGPRRLRCAPPLHRRRCQPLAARCHTQLPGRPAWPPRLDGRPACPSACQQRPPPQPEPPLPAPRPPLQAWAARQPHAAPLRCRWWQTAWQAAPRPRRLRGTVV